MTKIKINGKEGTAFEAIELLESLFGKNNAGAYLDILTKQDSISIMGNTISYTGAFPVTWQGYGACIGKKKSVAKGGNLTKN